MKHTNQASHRVVMLYDGVANSVFASQLLQPLHQWLQEDSQRTAQIISCERNPDQHPSHIEGIPCTYIKRLPYIATWSLWPAIYQVKKIVRNLATYELYARGPFAGYIAYKAANAQCQHITIQARGLAAQEYRFAQEQASQPVWYRSIRQHTLTRLEQKVYAIAQPNFTIEAVSKALGDYLIHTFNTNPSMLTIATHDIPQQLCPELRTNYRAAMRTHLGLTPTQRVYCYNGSYKPWQGPHETLRYFSQERVHNPDAHLLILTPDIKEFTALCISYNLPPATYTIKNISASEVIAYLAAADMGILFRTHDVINTTARPTKVLEYYAAGCTIVHNNTVDMIKTLPDAAHTYHLGLLDHPYLKK